MDNVNCVLHHKDVEYFLQIFEDLASPLGKDTHLDYHLWFIPFSQMKQGAPMRQLMTALALEWAIATYSTKKNEAGTSCPYEVLDCLRVLGAPIGSVNFCNNFIDKAIVRAQSDAVTLVSDLEDLKTTLRLFSVCMAHKVTHLFGHAVYNTPVESLLTNSWLWDSPMTTNFGNMTSELIALITNLPDLPPHAQLMANNSIKEGGVSSEFRTLAPMPSPHT
jgi:hypothetical protein